MTEIEIQKLIDINETQTTEFKKSTAEKEQICQTICAFANSEGGIILVGIKPDGTLYKVTFSDESQTDITNLFTNFDPDLKRLVSINKQEFNGYFLLVIEVQKSSIQHHCYKGKCYKRIGASSQPLSNEEWFNIRKDHNQEDWSAQICEGATIEDLDEQALEMARNGYLEKQKRLKNQSQIDIVTKIDLKKEPKLFLKYAKMLTKDDELSNSCLLLLGKDKNVVNCSFAGEIGYVEKIFGIKEVYSIPFQKAIIDVVNKISIKNIELPIKLLGEYTGNNKLLPNYTPDLLREFVSNCVAHQDYSQRSRIKVLETIHQSVVLINQGPSLYPKQDLEKFQIGNDIPNKYRNEALVNAMIEIGLMEAKGTGYNKLFQYNTKEVYLPLPRINWDNANQFEVKLYGAPLDKNFANILSQNTNLEPEVILLLDQVQKGFKVDQKVFNYLKKQGLVEGTPTKGKLSFEFMKLIGKENEYIDKSEDEHLKILIYKKIKQTKNCKRQNIEDYIYPKFPKNINEKQKYTKLHNMLTNLKNENWVESAGGRKHAIWVVKKVMRLE